MMNVSTRLFKAQDYEEIAKIYNACSGMPPVGAEKFAESDAARDPEEYFFRLIVELNGTVKGFCRAIVPLENGIRDEADLDIQIDPAARRLGLGRRVFQDASEILLRDGMKSVTSSYREDSPASACFVNELGFLEYDRYWNTRLSLQEKELPYLRECMHGRKTRSR
jgi:L-amino acid N-acyltransferase YncA